jgi:hypothetical protein
LLHSLKTREKVYVVDLGLMSADKNDIAAAGGEVIQHQWQLPETCQARVVWEKPFYLLDCPADDILWLDADCMVVGNLAPLWESDPMVVAYEGDQPAGENRAALYDQFPVQKRLPTTSMFSTAVMRWSKESLQSPLAVAWRQMVQMAGNEVHVRKLIMAADEGALMWAAAKIGNHGLISHNTGWNRPVGRGFRPHKDDVIHHYLHGAWKRPEFGRLS